MYFRSTWETINKIIFAYAMLKYITHINLWAILKVWGGQKGWTLGITYLTDNGNYFTLRSIVRLPNQTKVRLFKDILIYLKGVLVTSIFWLKVAF